MVSTRVTAPADPALFGQTGRRARVDPVKLLGLIHRIRTASAGAPALAKPTPKPLAKAS